MSKKCVGCGVFLQAENKELLGYTPDIKNDYCMRCFRLKNYGEINEADEINEDKILKKVNKGNGVAFFFIDYLNINNYTLNILKKIKIKKVLVISKVDVLRKDMKFIKIKKWLKNEYSIMDDILFLSNKTKFGVSSVLDYAANHGYHEVYIMGITNAGKSTFINQILTEYQRKNKILTSKKPNTTLDFIKLYFDDIVLFDTPGFTYPNMDSKIIDKEIKPITYQIKKDTTLVVGPFQITFLNAGSVTAYLNSSDSLKREYKKIAGEKLSLKENQDIVLLGYGFLNVKETSDIIINDIKNIEVRSSISGVNYE